MGGESELSVSEVSTSSVMRVDCGLEGVACVSVAHSTCTVESWACVSAKGTEGTTESSLIKGSCGGEWILIKSDRC